MTIPTQEEIAIAAAEGRLLDMIFKDSWRHDTYAYSQVLITAHQAKDINLRALLPFPEEPATRTMNCMQVWESCCRHCAPSRSTVMTCLSSWLGRSIRRIRCSATWCLRSR